MVTTAAYAIELSSPMLAIEKPLLYVELSRVDLVRLAELCQARAVKLYFMSF